ncbi:MAG TPA: alpha/beta hydrolase [Candidatus Mediterraneibacter avicola]|nr:alpha/beta hydrolase [Candidatus Mediterraneibacter avicola]
MIGRRTEIWREWEYSYPAAYGFRPIIVSYIHEDKKVRPCMLVVPGGGYRYVSSTEADPVARTFYAAGYNVFVLAYTVNYLDEPLKLQPLMDIARAVRIIRYHAEKCSVDPDKMAVCGFSAGAHLCASLCVHYSDISDPDPKYAPISARPDAAVLGYPVITSGEYAHKDSFTALLGADAGEKELEYMSLEKHVTDDMPPCFLWQTASDESVPVENSYLFAMACRKAGVPFAHHVFSEGIHGMSVATGEWLEGCYGTPYTLEQIDRLTEAIEQGATPYPTEKAEEIRTAFSGKRDGGKKWDPEIKQWLKGILDEVGMWTKLAEKWLEDRL